MICFSKNKKLSGIVVGNLNNRTMICYFTDEIYNTRGGDMNEIKETYKWYNYGGSGFEQLDPYTGDCPVTISDFDNIVDGCEDFVQRIQRLYSYIVGLRMMLNIQDYYVLILRLKN